jgi:heat shock protein HspQ
MTHSAARFSPGEIISHNRFEYRGVVVDVDPVFSGTDEWYDQVARSRPPKDAPWYHVLVDGSDHMTYVAERHLESAADKTPIDHPLISAFFTGYARGHYTNPQQRH